MIYKQNTTATVHIEETKITSMKFYKTFSLYNACNTGITALKKGSSIATLPDLAYVLVSIRYLKTHRRLSTAMCTRTYILTVLTQYNFGPRIRQVFINEAKFIQPENYLLLSFVPFSGVT